MTRAELRPGISFSDEIEAFKPASAIEQAAFDFAREAHAGTLRKDGSEFFTHCVAVANILRAWGVTDSETIAAALMHDLVEDTEIPLDEVRARFGETVANLVDGVTKLKSGGKSSEAETRRKIVEQGYFEPRVILIKLADRLHNMKTLAALPPEKQINKAQETLDAYAPLAESLGMWQVKTELEDLAFPYVDPERYQQVRQEVDHDPRLAESVVANFESQLSELLFSANLRGKVELRLKGYYEADKKRERLAKNGRGDGTLGIINDLISYRIVLDQAQPGFKFDPDLVCYTVLGLVHQHFGKAVDMERFDDFIVSPTTNKYSALQTTIRSSQGPVEVAITTKNREQFNHWGIVSKIQSGETDLREYTQKVVFTPTMKIKFFDREATGWDFAYRVTGPLAGRASNLEINGESKPMSTILPNAAIVKIIFGENLNPDKNELPYASSPTRQIMEQQISLAVSQEAITRGKAFLTPELAPLGLLELEDLAWAEGLDNGRLSQPLAELLAEFGCPSLAGLYAQLGHKRLATKEIIATLRELGISKEKLAWSTLWVTGSDQPGILAELTNLFNDLGKNIIGIQTNTSKGRFDTRIVVSGNTDADETKIRAKLATDSRFETFVLV